MKSFARRWLATLPHASRAYWVIQALVAGGAVLTGALMIEHVDGRSGVSSAGFLLRSTLDSLVLLLVTHVGIRPLLRLSYLQRSPGALAWFGLGMWLLLMGVVSVGLGLLIDHLKLTSSGTITAVRFQAGDEELGFALSGGPLYAIAVLNLAITYAIWTGLYLGWHAMRQRKRLQNQVREARLQQLTHQLNPHFLFNAFNTIRGTIFEDAARAADLLTELSELFRFHLSHAQRTSQTLDEEWRLAQRYLAIEQARLEHRLRVHVDLDPQCLDRSLPSLALLGLIENAIKHGIAPQTSGGDLQILARREPQHWCLTVSNSCSERGGTDHGTRTGLANLQERLELGYGPAAQMQTLLADGRYTVSLRMPW